MKKLGVLFLLLVLSSFFCNFVFAENLQEKIEGAEEKIETARESAESKWDYLSKEWKNIFLKNKFVSAVDGFFSEISIIFDILIGTGYTFSFAFLFILIVWFYLFYNLAYLLRAISLFPRGVDWILSFVIVVLFGQIGLYLKVVDWAGLLFSTLLKFIEFMFIAIILLVIILGILFYFFENFFKVVRSWYEKKIGQFKEQQRKEDDALFHMLVRGLSNIFIGGKSKRTDSPKLLEYTPRNEEELSQQKGEDTGFKNIDEALNTMRNAKSKDELKGFFRKAAYQFHPDKGGGNSSMKKINVLNDELKKKFS
ncbi:MAG: hypothetical protein ABH804_02740 [archaeon]